MFYFTAEEAGSTIKMAKADSYSSPTVYLETSPTGEEGSWTDFTVCTYNYENGEPNDDGTTITLANVGDKVYFRAKQDNERFTSANDSSGYNCFAMTGKIAASGNLNTLLKADGSVLDLTGRDYCFSYMFSNCHALTQAPELPATTLADNCYEGMFYCCSQLTKAPSILPATTLAESCYSIMFTECWSLTQAPALPAITLAEGCYDGMFSCCKLPFIFSDKTFDEVANLIQNQNIIGDYWCDENYELINPVEIICSDKTMLATSDEDTYEWTLTEK